MPRRSEITILLADGRSLVRAGLTRLLDQTGDLRVVAVAGDGASALAQAIGYEPDVLVVDAAFVARDPDLTRAVHERLPSCHVLLLDRGESRSVLVNALGQGAACVISVERPLEHLVEMIRALAHGYRAIPHELLSGSVVSMADRDLHSLGRRGRRRCADPRPAAKPPFGRAAP